jgi:hypothetical protein
MNYHKKFSNEVLDNSNFKVQSLVSRPAHQLRELGTQAYYGDIGCSQNFDFLLMEPIILLK